MDIILKIILEAPPEGVDFGLQKGSGNRYETVQIQRSNKKNLQFELEVGIKTAKDGNYDFHGPFVQGTLHQRFIYLDIGKSAGQLDSTWNRRLKIPLAGIPSELIEQALTGKNVVFETKVPGTARDGGPNCATVKPFSGWHLKKIENK
jgi:Family of unknown function (DUF5990)